MKKLILRILPFIILGSVIFVHQPVYALSSSCPAGYSAAKCSACMGINELGSSQNCSTNGSTATNIVSAGINILSYIIGVVAIIMIIFSGIRFAISGGNSSAVEESKKMLIYAIVGLVLAALAQVLVRWVLASTTRIAG